MGTAALLGGCASNSHHYYWGNYESMLYKTYAEPGEIPPEQQLDLLEDDLAKASERGKPVHPGLYAQIGLVRYELGDNAGARAAFEQEKALYPESTALMNRMLESVSQ
ncbi:MAG: DUF4810 domain-containing protein [Opitutales bacterium]